MAFALPLSLFQIPMLVVDFAFTRKLSIVAIHGVC